MGLRVFNSSPRPWSDERVPFGDLDAFAQLEGAIIGFRIFALLMSSMKSEGISSLLKKLSTRTLDHREKFCW
jgi:hypothetical protein